MNPKGSHDGPLLVEWPSILNHDRPLWLKRPPTVVEISLCYVLLCVMSKNFCRCYVILCVIHNLWLHQQVRYDEEISCYDWISPKANWTYILMKIPLIKISQNIRFDHPISEGISDISENYIRKKFFEKFKFAESILWTRIHVIFEWVPHVLNH